MICLCGIQNANSSISKTSISRGRNPISLPTADVTHMCVQNHTLVGIQVFPIQFHTRICIQSMVIFRFSGDTFAFAKHIGMETGFCKYASSAGYWTNLTKDLLSKQNFCYRFINHPGAFPCFSLCACCYKMKDLCVDFQAIRDFQPRQ